MEINYKPKSHMDPKRLLDRYIREGGDSLSDREMLGLALSFVDNIKDIGRTTDALYERFGSYLSICMAPHAELEEVPGMTRQAAALLILLRNVHQQTKAEYRSRIGKRLKSVEELFGEVIGITPREELWIAGIDDAGILRACDCVWRGTVNEIRTSIALIAEYASRNKLKNVVVAHNHPTISPLREDGADMKSLHLIGSVLWDFNIFLQKYIVIDREMHIFEYKRLD